MDTTDADLVGAISTLTAEAKINGAMLDHFREILEFAAMRLGYPNTQGLVDAALSAATERHYIVSQQLRYWATDAHAEGYAQIPVSRLRALARQVELLEKSCHEPFPPVQA